MGSKAQARRRLEPSAIFVVSAAACIVLLLLQLNKQSRHTKVASDSLRLTLDPGATPETRDPLRPRALTVTARYVNPDWGFIAARNLSEWRSSLLQRTPKIQVPDSWEFWDNYSPFMTCPPERPLTKYVGKRDDGDGTKYLCDVTPLRTLPRHEVCYVYSMGSNGDFAFEENMLNHTKCEVHTFDCTYNGSSIHPRHFYHKICLGTRAVNHRSTDAELVGLEFRTLNNITRSLGHHHVHVFKIDIEGAEFDALGGMQEGDQGLPEQISIEVHRYIIAKERPYASEWRIAMLFHHLASMGFGIVSRDDNIRWGGQGCCSEFTLFRVEESAKST